MNVQLSEKEISLIRAALETEIDKMGLMIESWEKQRGKMLEKIYGKKQFELYVKWDKLELKEYYKIDKKLWKLIKEK